MCFICTGFRLNNHFEVCFQSIRVKDSYPMIFRDCASWDCGHRHMGGRVVGVEGLWYGAGIRGSVGKKGKQWEFLAGKVVMGLLGTG
nr:hypothetical protein [Tanacetum cinerariifolium]